MRGGGSRSDPARSHLRVAEAAAWFPLQQVSPALVNLEHMYARLHLFFGVELEDSAPPTFFSTGINYQSRVAGLSSSPVITAEPVQCVGCTSLRQFWQLQRKEMMKCVPPFKSIT